MQKILSWAMAGGWWLAALGCQPTAVPPQNSAAYQQARRAVAARDFTTATAAYRQVLERHPSFVPAHLELALLADEKLADPITAIYHYRRCRELEPNADKRRVLDDYIERARLALAAGLDRTESTDTTELIRLQNQNAALMSELLALRAKWAEVQAATEQAGTAAVMTNPLKVAMPVSLSATNPVGTPQTAVAPARPAVHEVVRGDTLYSLALRYYGTRSAWEKIYRANQQQLPNQDQLRIGQRLVLP